jgi:hypothetical protein
MSIFCNILHFSRDAQNDKFIKLVFTKTSITCSSDAFCLTQDLLIRYSEKIFSDTGNIYILSFGQIFALLKKYNIYREVDPHNHQTLISIGFSDGHMHNGTQVPKLRGTKVLKLSEFKK